VIAVKKCPNYDLELLRTEFCTRIVSKLSLPSSRKLSAAEMVCEKLTVPHEVDFME